MENIQSLMANLTDEQVTEYQTAKYPPSVRDWARQEEEARVARRELAQVELTRQIEEEQAREARKATIAKIAKALEKVWTDDLTNVLITREEVDDMEHGEEVEVNGTKETRYPKVKSLVVRTNIFWSENKQVSPKAGKSETTKRAETVYKGAGQGAELIGNFRTGEEASKFLNLVPDKGSANTRLLRNGYTYIPYNGMDFTLPES